MSMINFNRPNTKVKRDVIVGPLSDKVDIVTHIVNCQKTGPVLIVRGILEKADNFKMLDDFVEPQKSFNK